jgi:hypothetical protein
MSSTPTVPAIQSRTRGDDPWAARVANGDWARITDEINEYGGALLDSHRRGEGIALILHNTGAYRGRPVLVRPQFCVCPGAEQRSAQRDP